MRASRSGEEEGVEAIRFSTVVVIVAVLFIEYMRQPSTKAAAVPGSFFVAMLRKVCSFVDAKLTSELAVFVDKLSF